MKGNKGSEKLILVVDDNVFSREGMVLFLKSKGHRTIEAGDSATALDLAGRDMPAPYGAIVDIVLPEFAGALPEMTSSEGIRLARKLKLAHPNTGVLVFSAFNDRGSEVLELAAEGIRGLAYMVKGAHPDNVLQAMNAACAGQVVIGQEVLNYANQLLREFWQKLAPDEVSWVRQALGLFGDLTPRERDVARLLAASRTTQGIADTLNISSKTVEKHTNHIYGKLQLNAVDQLDPPLRKALLLAKVCWLSELEGRTRL